MRTLFSKPNLSQRLEALRKLVPQRVSQIPSEKITSQSEDELTTFVFEDMRPRPPILKANIERLPEEETEIQLRDYGRTIRKPATLFTVVIPFEGNSEFFEWTPSHYTSLFPQADLIDKEVKVQFKVANSQQFDLDTSVKSKVDDINKYLFWVKEDIEAFSRQLEQDIQREINKRKTSLEAGQRLTEKSKIPVRKKEKPRGVKTSRSIEGISDKPSLPGYDVFISHASEDKDDFVRPLAHALIEQGLDVWFDELTLKLGDSLRGKIDYGLANSRYGIVVLSHAFFSKDWPQKELDGLVAREEAGKKVILPIWHRIEKEEVAQYSPTLAGLVAAKSNKGLNEVVLQIMEVLED